ncbi:Glyoxalase-like domain protein [Aquisphaera giovannonii]|uniref:Glyoxalase-like domain protein n=1 Tax=Aquisphaera giovannonii TaxID=406548 RepID=A0A5B9W0Q8_9BACT|nr:VOC family protein [Aquisphaera giovannonii]QEH33804.1 Glyoxalase-like domain protein [Aquisphaera giovannonii]
MAGFAQLTAMLQTRDMAGTIAFYTGLLGFSVASRWPLEDPVWCLLERDGARVMFMTNDHLGKPAMTGTLYIQTDDVLEVHRRLEGHVHVLWGPEVYEYGMHEFAIKDCNGYTISFGEPTDPAELQTSKEPSGVS